MIFILKICGSSPRRPVELLIENLYIFSWKIRRFINQQKPEFFSLPNYSFLTKKDKQYLNHFKPLSLCSSIPVNIFKYILIELLKCNKSAIYWHERRQYTKQHNKIQNYNFPLANCWCWPFKETEKKEVGYFYLSPLRNMRGKNQSNYFVLLPRP